MGEFEDAFEDEIEEDDEGEVIYNSDDSDEEGDATDGEGMEVDGKLHLPLNRLDLFNA